MAQVTMYPAKAGSTETTTTSTLTAVSTTVLVTELAVFPAVGDEGGNLLTLWADAVWETCEYTEKSSASGAGNLTIVRTGTKHASSSGSAIEWAAGTKIARTITAYDHDAFKANIEDHETRIGTIETDVSTIEDTTIPALDGRVTTLEDTTIPALDGRVTAVENKLELDPIEAAILFG